MPAKKRSSPKALTTAFAGEEPTTWYVKIQGKMYGDSASVKRYIHDVIKEAASDLPGVAELTVTAVRPDTRKRAKRAKK